MCRIIAPWQPFVNEISDCLVHSVTVSKKHFALFFLFRSTAKIFSHRRQHWKIHFYGCYNSSGSCPTRQPAGFAAFAYAPATQNIHESWCDREIFQARGHAVCSGGGDQVHPPRLCDVFGRHRKTSPSWPPSCPGPLSTASPLTFPPSPALGT